MRHRHENQLMFLSSFVDVAEKYLTNTFFCFLFSLSSNCKTQGQQKSNLSNSKQILRRHFSLFQIKLTFEHLRFDDQYDSLVVKFISSGLTNLFTWQIKGFPVRFSLIEKKKTEHTRCEPSEKFIFNKSHSIELWSFIEIETHLIVFVIKIVEKVHFNVVDLFFFFDGKFHLFIEAWWKLFSTKKI